MQLTRQDAISKIKEDYDKVTASMHASHCGSGFFAFCLAFCMRASQTYSLPRQTYFFTGVGDMDAYEPDCLFAGGHVVGTVMWLRHNLTSNQPEPLLCLQIHSRASTGEAGFASQRDVAIKPASLDLYLQGGAIQEERLKSGRPPVRMLGRACCICCQSCSMQ